MNIRLNERECSSESLALPRPTGSEPRMQMPALVAAVPRAPGLSPSQLRSACRPLLGRIDKKGLVSGHRADSGQTMTPSRSGRRGAFWVKSQDSWGQACSGGAPHSRLGSSSRIWRLFEHRLRAPAFSFSPSGSMSLDSDSQPRFPGQQLAGELNVTGWPDSVPCAWRSHALCLQCLPQGECCQAGPDI